MNMCFQTFYKANFQIETLKNIYTPFKKEAKT